MTMPTPPSTYSLQSLADIATAWGYDGRVAYPGPGVDEPALARGRIETRVFTSGIRWCQSDVQAAASHTREAVLERSLTVFLVSQGAPLHWRHRGAGRAHQGADTVAVCAVDHECRLTQSQDAGEALRCVVVQAQPEQIQDALLAEQLEQCLHATRVQSLPGAALHGLVHASARAAPYAGAAQAMYCESQALALLAHGLDALGRAGPSGRALTAGERRRLQRLCELLDAEPMASYTLVQLARESGFSLSALKDKFQRHTGQTVFDYLRGQRLQRARQGLLREGWSVKQAAYLCGYRHPANFSTAFRRQFGVPPSTLESP